MSYDIYFKDPVSRETIELDVPHFMRGGTFPLDGNAKRALITLLTMAQMRPDAIIKVEY